MNEAASPVELRRAICGPRMRPKICGPLSNKTMRRGRRLLHGRREPPRDIQAERGKRHCQHVLLRRRRGCGGLHGGNRTACGKGVHRPAQAGCRKATSQSKQVVNRQCSRPRQRLRRGAEQVVQQRDGSKLNHGRRRCARGCGKEGLLRLHGGSHNRGGGRLCGWNNSGGGGLDRLGRQRRRRCHRRRLRLEGFKGGWCGQADGGDGHSARYLHPELGAVRGLESAITSE